MAEIFFTTAGYGANALAALQEMLQQFKQSYRHTVRIQSFPWDRIWNEIARIAIHKQGPDVSEIGTSWIGSLVEMEALRPFSRVEVASIGGRNAFIPAAWTSTGLTGGDQVWTIPFLAEARVIFYWKDMLRQAGVVDDANAFRSLERMENTLDLLRQVIPTPWAAVSQQAHDALYQSLSWIWAAGGDCVSPDGQRVTLTQPATMAGLKAYFGLYRFTPQDAYPIDGPKVNRLFLDRKVAAIMNGPWFINTLKSGDMPPEFKAEVGVALPPGPPFVGGTHLGIWRHSVRERDAIDLIRFLTLTENQIAISKLAGFLPVRVSVLDMSPYSTDVYYSVFAEALRVGRAITPVTLWGMMEEKLVGAYSSIWSEIVEQPDRLLGEILHDILDPLASRLQKLILPK